MKLDISFHKECQLCGRRQDYANITSFRKAVKNDSVCNNCKLLMPELQHLAREMWIFEGWIAVYLLPRENYVGVSHKPRVRIGQHKTNHNKDITDAAVVYWAKTLEEAALVEAVYHYEGYEGCQLKRNYL